MSTPRGILKPDEIQAVASYIYGFRGTTPPNPKPREDQAAPTKPNDRRVRKETPDWKSPKPSTKSTPALREANLEQFREHLATADKQGHRRWLHPRKPSW